MPWGGVFGKLWREGYLRRVCQVSVEQTYLYQVVRVKRVLL